MSSWDTNSWSTFCDPHRELICRNKWHPGISEISKPPEIAVGMHLNIKHVNIKPLFSKDLLQPLSKAYLWNNSFFHLL